MCFSCDVKPCNKDLKAHIDLCQECFDESLRSFQEYKEERIRNGKLNPEYEEILPGKMWLGNQDTALTKDVLQKLNIPHVLVVGSFLDQRFPEDFTYKQILIQDNPEENIAQHFPECHEFIEGASSVYVHCAAGVSRSASVVISYVMKTKQWSLFKAYDYVKKIRAYVRPNDGFQRQLYAYQQELKIETEPEFKEYEEAFKCNVLNPTDSNE